MSDPAGSFVIKTKKEDPNAPEADEVDEQEPVAHTPINLSTKIEWARTGTQFYARPCADKFPVLPGGIYRFVAPPMAPWYLERTADRFEFPFKIYNASGSTIHRVCKHWAFHGGSLGVLLNGLRGAGKSVTAKLAANALRDKLDLPILVVRDPIPLDVVFDNVQQHMVVIFDEFEKSHDERLHPGCQQRLLSTIDGMSRSEFNRLLLFTTNSTNINENFKDRPSRIHYKFEFNRISDEIVEGLINDMLPEHLQQFRNDIFAYLNTREICTIDIVRAVLKEVIAFEESPLQFEDLINVEKSPPPSFTIQVVDPETKTEIKHLASHWKLNPHEQNWAPLLSGNRRSLEEFSDSIHPIQIAYNPYDGPITLKLLEPCLEEAESGYFLANVCLPLSRTYWDKYPNIRDNYGNNYALWLDERPEGWEPLPSPKTIRLADEEKTVELEQEIWNRFQMCQRGGQTLFGSGKPGVYMIKVTPNTEKQKKQHTVVRSWDS